ncbi:MAG: imidazolonepropionase [Clostridia bacterium]|nr:MAG: imidazolonepropionase [Clostridia bacterium]
MARKYEKVQEMLPVVRQLAEAGDTQQQIADKLGLNNVKVVRNLLWKEKKKDVQGVPRQRSRKTAKTLQEYKYENKRLKMEVELLRDFLSLTERK